MEYSARQIASILGQQGSFSSSHVLTAVSTDTRTIKGGEEVVFFGITTANRSGADYLHEAAAKGVRLAVVDHLPEEVPEQLTLLVVDDTVRALQQLAAYHRSRFDIPVVGITGSYGKTIVKEWLAAFLDQHHKVCKSPQSYNSQIGVPLSVLNLDESHTVAIFEVGVSEAGEMQVLADIVRPTHGIFTTIGRAHAAGFASKRHKAREKAALFAHAQAVVCFDGHGLINESLKESLQSGRTVSWGEGSDSHYQVRIELPRLQIVKANQLLIDAAVQLSSAEMVQDLIHAIVMADVLGTDPLSVAAILPTIAPLPMRLEASAGRRGSLLINDTYSADVQSLRLALDYQQAIGAGYRKTVILSDIDNSHGVSWLEATQALLDTYQIEHLVTVGEVSQSLTAKAHSHYPTTAALLADADRLEVAQSAVLIKGAREYGLERVYDRLQSVSHSATLEIDLAAIQHNLQVYQELADTDLMVVVKASAYGSGSAEVARLLQRRGVAYLAVAFTDEAVALRKSQITIPILVLNPDLDRLEDYCRYNIDLEVHALQQLDMLTTYLQIHPQDELRVHLMLDTGMKRLGFEVAQIPHLTSWLEKQDRIKVVSIFSHLAASEAAGFDTFTRQQLDLFDDLCNKLPSVQYYHILNTAGIVRFAGRQRGNMVRLGLGMYGIDSTGTIQEHLQPAHQLTATVLQVKSLMPGESVGYGRAFIADRPTTICTVNIGYADGLLRSLGEERYAFRLGEELLPIIGRICMDLTMCRVPDGVTVEAGDVVTVFGPDHPVEDLARSAGTIPYEVLSRIAPRVKRIYLT